MIKLREGHKAKHGKRNFYAIIFPTANNTPKQSTIMHDNSMDNKHFKILNDTSKKMETHAMLLLPCLVL